MKKKVVLVLVAIMSIGQSVFASYDFSAVASSGQTLYYTTDSTNPGTVTVTCPGSSSSWEPYLGYTEPTGNLTIPNSVTYSGTTYSVTSIGGSAFFGCSGLTSVTIPNSVTSIGGGAFYNCSSLTSVTIPNSVTSIDGGAFYNCSSLTSVTIPNSVTSIGGGAFQDCNGLTSVIISNSVTSIGEYAFQSCTSLTSVIIPNSVTSIGHCAFNNCSGMTSVTIPNSVTSIGYYAFCFCPALTTVTIPNSVTSIGNYAFMDCTGLTSVVFNADSCISAGSSDYPIFSGCSNLTNITFGNNIKHIPSSLCYGCSGLTSVTIPNSVTSIGYEAFHACINLDTVYMIPSTPPSLDGYAFANNASDRVFVLICFAYNNYYYSSSWSDYRYRLRDPVIDINVNVSSSDVTRGTAAVVLSPGYQTVRCDSTVVVQATANYGYHFDHWSTGSTANPDTITLTGDSTITAFFAPNQYTLTVNAGEYGTAMGSGTYNFGDTITIQAVADDHYHFTRWNDGNTNNPRQYRIEDNITLTAFFVIDTYSVSVVSSDIICGMVEASGTEFVYGTPCTVTATAYTGYTFAGWSNGITANPYTFAVISDVELTALFVEEGEEVYTVTVESADPTMGSVSGGGQALSGGTLTIRAIPNEGYRFQCWNDGNTENPRTVTVTENITYTAYFESMTQGIANVDEVDMRVYAIDGHIYVNVDCEPAEEFRVYDVTGREVFHAIHTDRTSVLPGGIYLVKVGILPARRVVVIQ